MFWLRAIPDFISFFSSFGFFWTVDRILSAVLVNRENRIPVAAFFSTVNFKHGISLRVLFQVGSSAHMVIYDPRDKLTFPFHSVIRLDNKILQGTDIQLLI
jgi:hypothetical protein